MTAFGIITTEDDNTEHYVGEDDVLWDWVHADNYEPAPAGRHRVKAPEGYTFHQGNLFPKGYDGDRDYESVTLIGSPEKNKATMLLVALRFVSPEEFSALNIEKSRIMEIHIPRV
jgi:hypothetical protein